MELVSKIDPLEPSRLDQTAYDSKTIAAPTNPVAGLTSTGNTSTEGVDKLSYVVGAEGLHLITMVIAGITNSNAATSHYIRPIISWTVPTGNPAIVGLALTTNNIGTGVATQITDAAGAAVANSMGLDAKASGDGSSAGITFPVLAKAGSTITLQFSHTVTGACTNGGTYRIGMSIHKL